VPETFESEAKKKTGGKEMAEGSVQEWAHKKTRDRSCFKLLHRG